MMKKFLLVALIAFGLVACSKKEEAVEAPAEVAVEASAPVAVEMASEAVASEVAVEASEVASAAM